MKKCTVCKKRKPLTQYHNMKRAKDGKRSQCKICHRKAVLEYRKNNHDKCTQTNKKYYLTNKTSILEKSRCDYKKNPQKFLSKNKKWAEQNKEKLKTYHRKWRKNKWKNDVNYKIKYLLRHRFWSAVTRNAKKSSVLDLLGCSIENLKIYLSSKFIDGMSWDNHGEWHIDHIIPCSSFDLTKFSEQQKCFHYTNLQPLWAKDNIRKSDKLI